MVQNCDITKDKDCSMKALYCKFFDTLFCMIVDFSSNTVIIKPPFLLPTPTYTLPFLLPAHNYSHI